MSALSVVGVVVCALSLCVLSLEDGTNSDIIGDNEIKVEGIKPIEVYYHVRYATAKRFGDPVVADYTEPSPDGKNARVMCPQLPLRLNKIFGSGEGLRQDEDCQFLTVFTPSRKGNYSVMVWIHGGSYVSGNGEDYSYDASALAEEGQMVVVTVSYRLGIFGYLNNIEAGEYNMGLKDQIAALKWVQKYISHFGGDPQRVTLAGESAGAHAVATIVANTAEPLFQKVIIQSAPFVTEVKDADAQKTYNYIREQLGKDPKEVTVQELLDVQDKYMKAFHAPVSFGPYESKYYEKPPNPALRKALVTWMRDDSSIFVALLRKHFDNYGSMMDRIIEYFVTNRVFKRPAKRFATHLEKYGVECETFQIDYRPTGSPFGAAHGLDITLLFSSWERWKDAALLGNATKEEWQEQGVALRAKWIDFINQ